MSQAEFMVGFSGEADKLFADANQTASEAFSNIRTVRLQQTPPADAAGLPLASSSHRVKMRKPWSLQPFSAG